MPSEYLKYKSEYKKYKGLKYKAKLRELRLASQLVGEGASRAAAKGRAAAQEAIQYMSKHVPGSERIYGFGAQAQNRPGHYKAEKYLESKKYSHRLPQLGEKGGEAAFRGRNLARGAMSRMKPVGSAVGQGAARRYLFSKSLTTHAKNVAANRAFMQAGESLAKAAGKSFIRGGLQGVALGLAAKTGIEGAKALRERMRAKRIDQYNLEQYGTPERAAETRRRKNAK